VLSIGKLAAGAGDYYSAMVADGAEEYFTGAREAPGEWVGAGSDVLALSGIVDPGDFAAILEHRYPATSVRITAARSAPKVSGFDATFCAPKSVSVLHGLGTDDTVTRVVRDAHDASVRAALTIFEAEASRGRRGHGGVEVVEGDGFVAAGFRHRTSRAGDPHLHTHVVIANLVHGPDDRWTSLDARPLFHWSKTVGYLYEAQLRHELTEHLGVQWTGVRNGIADMTIVPRPVIDAFSTRRHEIEAHLEASGFDSARAAQIATYATRRMKDHSATAETLADGWRSQADTLGFDIDSVTDQLADPVLPATPVVAANIEELFVELAGPTGLTQHRAMFGRREVLRGICQRLPNGAPVEQIVRWAEQFIESDHCIALYGEQAAAIRTRDGRVISAHTDGVRFTTPDMLATERRLVGVALTGAGTGTAMADLDRLWDVVAASPTITDEQITMVLQICTSGNRVDVVEGVAGAGKTFALAVANDAWVASGYQVIGCSLAAKAARQLETYAHIRSHTIDRLLIDLDQPEHGGLPHHAVVIVDEAAMVGTRKLVRLLEHAQQADAKIVLVGDPRQLPEIEAGGGFVGLADRLRHTALTENRRQSSEWERDALARLRTGDTDNAIDTYLDHGRINISPNAAHARSRMVADWAETRTSQTAVMLASRVADVEELNRLARHHLHDTGDIADDDVRIAGRGFATGDLVLALRNDRRVDVLNGTRAVIERIDHQRRVFECRADDQHKVTIPFDYATDGHLTHAYAMTVHKSQGATFDRCFVLAGDQLTNETTYTAMSRGRAGNDLYVVDDDPRVDEAHMREQRGEPLDTLRSTVRRSGAQTMATEALPGPPAAPEVEFDDDLGIDL